MPHEFEFNADLILFIAETLDTGKYGTFMLNSSLERLEANL